MVRVAGLLLALAFLPFPAFAEGRIALLIGNESYTTEIGRLANPHNDVALLEQALKGLGFDVVTVRDAGLDGLNRAVNAYVRRLQAAGQGAVGFFYYSGHGVSDGGTWQCFHIDDYLRPNSKHCFMPSAGKTAWFKDCPTCPEMVVVPAGTFTMGSPENEPERNKDELQVPVSIAASIRGRAGIRDARWQYNAVLVGAVNHPRAGQLRLPVKGRRQLAHGAGVPSLSGSLRARPQAAPRDDDTGHAEHEATAA